MKVGVSMAIDIRAQREVVFVLMHKDVDVLEYNMSGKCVTVLNADMVPWGFNYLGFEEWCAGRVLSMSRKNAKYIMNALMVSQDNSVRTKMQLALAYHCLSLNDCYWVRRKSDGSKWEDVSLFRNKTENVLTPVSLCGKVSSLFGKKLANSCDITVDGTYRKSWVRTDVGFELYKGDDTTQSKECIRECLASTVLRALGFNAIEYAYVEYQGELVCRSECFTSENIEFIPFNAIKQEKENALEFVKAINLDDYCKLTLATYIIGNIDLHDGNWGLIRNLNSGLLSFAPLFDFNNAFSDEYVTRKDIQEMWIPAAKLVDLETGDEVDPRDMFLYDCRYTSEYTIQQAAQKAARLIHFKIDRGALNQIHFYDQAIEDECIHRVTEINSWSD